MNTEKKLPRKIFTVLIHDREYDVYDIDGKEHSGAGDVPKEWWIYYSDRLPGDEIPPEDSEQWEPMDPWLLRRCWEFKIKQSNSSKHKWGEYQFSSHTSVEMWCNKKLIYEFGTNGRALDFAFGKIQYLIVILAEHSFNFFDPKSENGRKIYWYGLPATVRISEYQSWEISIVPDYTAGLNEDEWWAKYKDRKTNLGTVAKPDTIDNQFEEMDEEWFTESRQNGYIRWGDAMSDQNIDWHRK